MSLLHAEKFRTIGKHASERVKWLRAVEGTLGPNGELPNSAGKFFVDQLLDEQASVRIYTAYQNVQDEDYGMIRVAQTHMRFMPDEIQPLRDDRFVCLQRAFDARQVLAPSDSATRSLNAAYVSDITEIQGVGRILRPSTYALQNGRLRWYGPPPDESVTVFYRYLETYEFLGEEFKQGPIDRTGTRLPSWVVLKLLTAGEE